VKITKLSLYTPSLVARRPPLKRAIYYISISLSNTEGKSKQICHPKKVTFRTTHSEWRRHPRSFYEEKGVQP
jgi:hypothetical protein